MVPRSIVYSFCICLFLHANSPAAVLEVVPDGAYGNIARAVSEASSGDTVLVHTGLYLETSIFVKEGTTLVAAGGASTVIAYKPYMSQGNILTCANGAVIRGFWLVGAPVSAINGWGDGVFRLQNCIIWGNVSVLGGYYGERRAIITNCTIFGNQEGIVCENGSAASLHNSIVWGNSCNLAGDVSASHCNIEGGWPGQGNTDAHPMFMDPQEPDWPALRKLPYSDPIRGDLRLTPGSPCIDTGNNKPAHFLKTDILGNPRILFGGRSRAVDMGAYEYLPLAINKAPSGMLLTWGSAPDKTYEVQYSADLIKWKYADTIAGTGYVTSWTDLLSSPFPTRDSAPSHRFYRILKKP